jgi:hypothetical protein
VPVGVVLVATTAVLTVGSSRAFADEKISVTALAPPNGSFGGLGAVSCPEAGSCVAVGSNVVQVNEEGDPLAATLVDGVWSSVELPLPADAQMAVTGAPDMTSIVCTSIQACIAVGTYAAFSNGQGQTEGLVETESGGTWQVTSTGTLALSALACATLGTCVAAGIQFDASGSEPVLATQSGDSWAVSPVGLPNDSTGFYNLGGIACPASGSCVAVGSYINTSDAPYPMVVTQTNGSWQGVPVVPPDGSKTGQLTGIACAASGTCTVTGNIGLNGGGPASNSGGFVFSGTAGTWQAPTMLPSPPDAMSSTSGVYPRSLACSDSGSCLVVGSYSSTTDECPPESGCSTHPFADVESGGSWSAVTVPTPSDTAPDSFNQLDGVACWSAGNCMAVGTYGGTSHSMFAATFAPGNVTQLYGTDAVGTAIAISQAEFPTAGSARAVVLARSDFYTDALAGGPFAAHVGGPLLVTPGTSLSSTLDPRVQTEIQRVLPAGGTVYVLGGNLALSPTIDATLQNLGYDVVREAGADEYATAVDIAEALGNPTAIFEATGLDFPDALSAVPAAITQNAAILLTDGTTQAPETGSYLAAHPGDTRYAIGGPLAALGADPTATGVYGADLYGTSAAVAARFFPNAKLYGAATGLDFPDSLAGGVFMATGPRLGPMLLVDPGAAPPVSSAISSYLATLAQSTPGYVFGGPLAVPSDVIDDLQAAVG